MSQIITRRNLPHWYVPGAFHFVTFRLAGTIPQQVLAKLRADRDAQIRNNSKVEQGGRERAHKEFFRRYDEYLDSANPIDWLRQPRIAALVRSSLYYHDRSTYYLLAWCIMPNHVHVLLQPIGEVIRPENYEPDEKADNLSPLARILHSLKSYTAHEANKLLNRTGTFWQHESYDHWGRDEEELERIIVYIAGNPVKAKLVSCAEDWYYGSAHDRFLQDGSTEDWLKIP